MSGEQAPPAEISLRRRNAAKVLGVDGAWEVFKWNLAYLLAVKCVSVSFIWVLIAVLMLAHSQWIFVVQEHKDLPNIYVYHAITALAHWANRPLLERIVEANAAKIESKAGV